jgi:hypothetical protein
VQATLVSFKREEDEDIHLVIADPSDRTHTMIVEFLTPIAARPSHGEEAEMERVRRSWRPAVNRPRRSVNSPARPRSPGGLFDKKHGQRGLAPNGIELHPTRVRKRRLRPAGHANAHPSAHADPDARARHPDIRARFVRARLADARARLTHRRPHLGRPSPGRPRPRPGTGGRIAPCRSPGSLFSPGEPHGRFAHRYRP